MTDHPRREPPMPPALGALILVASGLGFPLTQFVIVRFGRRGAIVAEGVSAGLLVRDVTLVKLGAPRRLSRMPSLLLWFELAAAAIASVAGLGAVSSPRISPTRSPAGIVEGIRQAAVGVLFGVHTYRFWIYLRPDRGLRETARAPERDSGSPMPPPLR
jgi:hypothetical protein